MKADKFGLLERDIIYILSAIKVFPEIEKAMIFGSRALGSFKKGSDIDIACYGKNVNFETTSRLKSKLNEELPIPFFIDVLHFNTLKNSDLKKHIEQFGVTLYSCTSE